MSPEELGKVRVMMLLMVFNIAFTFPMSIWGAVINAYEKFVFPKAINIYNPQNEMFRLLGTKRSFSQNETFFFSHPYPALFRLISHF